MCEESPENMIKSVLPIITKCKQIPVDEDDPEETVELDMIKN